jgi:hypothetical protein
MREDATADDIERAMVSRGIPTDGVDFQAIADAQNDASRFVEGWQAPRVLPPDWIEFSRDDAGGAKYVNATRKLVAILSCGIEQDGRAWLHLSVSHRERIPTHGEMRTVKELFLGDRYAYAVWPPRAKYINLYPNVLHVFALLVEGANQPLPDFTGGSGSL